MSGLGTQNVIDPIAAMNVALLVEIHYAEPCSSGRAKRCVGKPKPFLECSQGVELVWVNHAGNRVVGYNHLCEPFQLLVLSLPTAGSIHSYPILGERNVPKCNGLNDLCFS